MAVLDLVGVLENGAVRDDRLVPQDARVPLRLVQGGTLQVRLNVLTAGGVPVPLTGTTLTLIAKRKALTRTVDLSVAGALTPEVGSNRATFTLSAAVTARLVPGRYTYAVWLTQGDVRNAVIPLSALLVEPGLPTA